MKHVAAAALGSLLAFSIGACSDAPSVTDPAPSPVDPTAPPPQGMVVSNAVARASGVDGGTVAFVSAVPGTFQRAASAWVINETRGGVPGFGVQLIDGGFDPVAVEAKEGENLKLTVFAPTGEQIRVRVRVPARRAPAVVRTSPGNGGFFQPLDVRVVAVFSEPVESSSITFASVSLMHDDSLVRGRHVVSRDGLSVEFVPDAGLEPGTDYAFRVTDHVRDTEGDRVTTPYGASFTTAGVTQVPAGLELIFTRADRQIYRVGHDGKGLTQMTLGGNNLRPVWSPDGTRIAFAKNSQGPANNGFGTTDIYLMSASGDSHVRRTVDANFRSAEWSPDGRTLAVSDEGTYYGDIWIIGVDDGSSPVRIATQARSPAWSPDGRKIAFVSLSGDDGYHQVVVMNADGSDQVPLTENDGGGIYGLGWSPDGTRIAFSKCLWNRGCDVYVMNADGSGLEQITSLGNVHGGEWSPDGEWLAVTRNDYSGGHWAPSIGYVPAKGGALRVVSDGYWPSWRPAAR